jgi:hypothetical protein
MNLEEFKEITSDYMELVEEASDYRKRFMTCTSNGGVKEIDVDLMSPGNLHKLEQLEEKLRDVQEDFIKAIKSLDNI